GPPSWSSHHDYGRLPSNFKGKIAQDVAPCAASEYSCRSIAKGLTARIAGLLSKTCLRVQQRLKTECEMANGRCQMAKPPEDPRRWHVSFVICHLSFPTVQSGRWKSDRRAELVTGPGSPAAGSQSQPSRRGSRAAHEPKHPKKTDQDQEA